MAQSRLIFFILLLVINLNSSLCDDDSIETSTLKAIISGSNQTMVGGRHFVSVRDEEQFMECMHKKCPIKRFTTIKKDDRTDERHKIHLALLLPSLPPPDQENTQTILSTILPVIELAIQQIEQQKLLNGIELLIHPRDTKCSSSFGPIEAFELHKQGEADVFLGPVCDYVLAPVARYAAVWETTIISTGGLATAFNHKDQTKGYSSCHHILAPIHKSRTNGSNHPILRETFDHDYKYTELTEKLSILKEKSRIIIMCANPQTIREIMIAAEELNMIDSGEYVFFNIEIFGSIKKDPSPWLDINDLDERNKKAKKAYEALLTITTRKPDNEEYQKFSDDVKLLAKEKYNYTYDETNKLQISQFVSAFHDAVLLFANALNESIRESGENALLKPLNGTRLTQLMWGREFKGITGNVSIDPNGDRLSDYSLLDMNPNTNHFEIVANYFHKDGLQFIENKTIHWAGGRTTPPADKPECGFDGSLCPPEDSSTMFAILSLVLGFVVIIMAIVSFITYRHYRLEAEISSMTWKITWNEVIPLPTANQIRNSIHSRAGSQISVYSDDLDRQIFIPIGSYKGNTCAIKKINVPINLTRSLMMELKAMKDIQHDHLVRFYGAVIDSVPCILTEYCPKGSLQDILENHEINLDMMFKLSLMHDIARGMHFLHTTSIHSHGQLKSSNCVVDSRFVCKITDYGIHELRKPGPDDVETKESHEYWKKYLWTSPELLRAQNCPDRGTQKGDVYSFAIIIQEICCRQGVFYLGNRCVEKEPREIVQLVTNCPIYPNEPFRPIIDEGRDSCCDVNSLMVKCWAEDPNDRPDFSQIKSMIRKINKENESGNILDNLLKRMEHYAQNLETLVDERTRDYLEEKKKCEELLYQLLPKSIASQLIEGQSVIAEMYDAVTIYFSDIVGFTSISAESTPMQVVDLLNDLYTCFDKIVGHFDVYKVETIGDAYMVVSGLPVRNGDYHAREIARMALALLAKVHNFKIRHRPNDTLKLRIGIHSGPACAGVVGLKMPRYCLFGDTVNTASRMESNGEALKIHISHSTKQILDKFGTFDIESRGYVSMKGKGEMMTYWLNGEKTPEVASHTKLTSAPSLPTIELSHHHNNNNIINLETNGNVRDVKFNDNNHTQEAEKPNSKAIAVVPPLTPQNSFNSKKNFIMNSSLRGNLNSCSSLKDLSHQPLINGKKPVMFKRKQINFANEKLQPLLS